MPKSLNLIRFLPILLLLLAGCEQLGIENPAQEAAARDAEGRAVGGACRHSGRALEDCYILNPKALKAAIFTGWRDMDAYMRENNIEIVNALLPKVDKKKLGGQESPAKAEEAPVTKEEGAAHSSTGTPPPPAAGGAKKT